MGRGMLRPYSTSDFQAAVTTATEKVAFTKIIPSFLPLYLFLNPSSFSKSDLASYVTGQVIQVDGGMNM